MAISSWLLPASRWATFLKQGEEVFQTFSWDKKKPLFHQDVTRDTLDYPLHICIGPATMTSKGASALRGVFLSKWQGNRQVLLSASKISADKFNSSVHRASIIILVVIVSLKHRTAWIPNAKGKYQLEVGGIRVDSCVELWREAGFRQGSSCCWIVVFFFTLFCITFFWSSKSVVAKPHVCLLVIGKNRTERVQQ